MLSICLVQKEKGLLSVSYTQISQYENCRIDFLVPVQLLEFLDRMASSNCWPAEP